MGCQGNLERTWKVSEKSGNLKTNGFRKFILFRREKDLNSHEIV